MFRPQSLDLTAIWVTREHGQCVCAWWADPSIALRGGLIGERDALCWRFLLKHGGLACEWWSTAGLGLAVEHQGSEWW